MSAVDVIVPTHNRPRLLAQTLRSILTQRDVDFAVTVVDDGSADAAAVAAVVAGLGDPRVRVVRHERAQGVSAARNTGIASTTGEWLAFCDDDDLWAPDKLRAQLDAAGDTAEWAYTGEVSIDDALAVLAGGAPPRPHELVADLGRYNTVPAGSSNVLIRRRLLERVGVFDPALKSVGDWDLWVRLGRAGVPGGVDRPLVGCRQHGHTITRNRRLMLAEVDLVARRHGLPVDRARHYRWAAWNAMREGCRAEAVGYYTRAVAAGDVASIARAVVALVHPGISRPQWTPPGEWAREAEAWLRPLRADANAAAGAADGSR